VPPITAPAPLPGSRSTAGGAPEVDSYDEETYRLRPGDTYRKLSLAFYNTEKYERALELWNRNHPQASDGARQDPPILQPGQDVYLPPIRMLEKHHGKDVPDAGAAAPVAPPAVPAPSGSVGLDVPRPMGTPIAAAGPAAPPAPAAPAVEEKAYRVRGTGEVFWTVARRTLGSGERWVDIYKMNPRYDPKQTIPPGAVLRLPKEAQVAPEDVP
jgi:nucleoid-associated protein YgaU